MTEAMKKAREICEHVDDCKGIVHAPGYCGVCDDIAAALEAEYARGVRDAVHVVCAIADTPHPIEDDAYNLSPSARGLLQQCAHAIRALRDPDGLRCPWPGEAP